MTLVLDHLAVACTNLDEGAAWVAACLGVSMLPGGRHPRYGTHNRLLGLADGLYLEVIAVDPGAAPPTGPRWFDLDNFGGPPRLANWICATPDLSATLAACPVDVGPAQGMQRGDRTWQITVPDDGSLPYDGGFPTLIEWPKDVHPAAALPDSGCRLTSFTVSHPEAEELKGLIDLTDPRVNFTTGSLGFRAIFNTPDGLRALT